MNNRPKKAKTPRTGHGETSDQHDPQGVRLQKVLAQAGMTLDDIDLDDAEALVWNLLTLINPGDEETALRQFAAYRDVAGEPDAGDREGDAEHAARRVAFAAMRECLHEIGAAVDLRRSRPIGLERARGEVQPFPHRHAGADVERKADIVFAVGLRHGRQAAEVRVDGIGIISGHLRVVRVQPGQRLDLLRLAVLIDNKVRLLQVEYRASGPVR